LPQYSSGKRVQLAAGILTPKTLMLSRGPTSTAKRRSALAETTDQGEPIRSTGVVIGNEREHGANGIKRGIITQAA